MSSKFSQRIGLLKKPGVCKAGPAPGPIDDRWPPRLGTGLCKWEGNPPGEPQYLVQGICNFTWHPGPREYRAVARTGDDMVEIRCTLAFGNEWFNTYFDYWMNGVYKRSAYSYHHNTVPGQPILISAAFKVRPDYVHSILFSLSAFPST